MSDITRRGFMKGAALAPLALNQPFPSEQAGPTPIDKRSDRYDVVVVGAGHNSLAAACYLAKAGLRCLVLEGRPMIGGSTKTAQLTLDGFWSDVCSCDHLFIVHSPMLRNNELNLGEYGLEYIYSDPGYHMTFPNGRSITVWKDFDRTCDEIARFSKKDADTFRRMSNEFEPIRKILGSVFFNPLGFVPSVEQQLAALPDGQMWLRRRMEAAWDIWHQRFEDPHVITFMMSPWPTNVLGPMSGFEAYGRANLHPVSPLPKGGSGMLAVALGRYLEAHGGTILVNKPVTQLIIENGKCVGAECADGSQYRAEKAVLSTVHAKLLPSLAPKELWGKEFIEGLDSFHIGPSDGLNVHFALKGPLQYKTETGEIITPFQSTTLSSPERGIRYEVELASGEVNMEDPVLHAVLQTAFDPSRAPKGMHVLRILARAPYNLKDGGWKHWDDIKEQVADANLKAIQRRAYNFTDDLILERFICTPPDFFAMNASQYEGCNFGGYAWPSQAGTMRPVPGWAEYRMPIPGLYQTGGTTHPGFGVTSAPGRNAAQIMMTDFGMDFKAVAAKKEKA